MLEWLVKVERRHMVRALGVKRAVRNIQGFGSRARNGETSERNESGRLREKRDTSEETELETIIHGARFNNSERL